MKLRRLFRRHRHDWRHVAGPTAVGWSVYECATCGYQDIG